MRHRPTAGPLVSLSKSVDLSSTFALRENSSVADWLGFALEKWKVGQDAGELYFRYYEFIYVISIN